MIPDQPVYPRTSGKAVCNSIMRDYLKILSSITAALLTLTVLVSVISGIFSLASGRNEVSEAMLFPFVIAWVGFISFGITGSIAWFVFVRAFDEKRLGPMSRHVVSASMATAASWLTVAFTFSGGGVKEFFEASVLLIPVVPVVALSLLWYWCLFYRSRRGKAR